MINIIWWNSYKSQYIGLWTQGNRGSTDILPLGEKELEIGAKEALDTLNIPILVQIQNFQPVLPSRPMVKTKAFEACNVGSSPALAAYSC